MPVHEEGEGKGPKEAADFSHRGGNPVAGGAYFYREDLRWVDEGRGVGAKLGEEIAESVDEQECDGQLFYVRDNREQTEGAGHHTEAQTLDGFAAQFIHG